MKPEKEESFFNFYIVNPFLHLLGWWKCDGCSKWYSPRVAQYGLFFTYCSRCKNK